MFYFDTAQTNHSNIFYGNSIFFYETNKEIINIENCEIKTIQFNNNNINIDYLNLSQNKLDNNSIKRLEDMKNKGKIKKYIY